MRTGPTAALPVALARAARGAAMGAAIAIAAAWTLACSSVGAGGSEPVCTPGRSVVCVCPDGTGAQRCRDDGTGFEDCRCPRELPDATEPGDAGDREPDEIPDSGEPDSPDDDPPGDTAVEDLPADDPPTDATTEDTAAPDTGATDTGATDTSPTDTSVTDAPLPDGTPTPRALGAECAADAECASGICLLFATTSGDRAVCASPCCHEEECPAGFGCVLPGGSVGSFCVPARVFPGATFSGVTGSTCGTAGYCKSDLCDGSVGRCRGSCCTDADCGATHCYWTPTRSSMRAWCNPISLLGAGYWTGVPCASEFDCRSGICAQSGLDSGFYCADMCCSSAECPGGTTCGLVAGIGGAVARACVQRAAEGSGGAGDSCTIDEDCDRRICIDGACRAICCQDTNCARGERCLPRDTLDGAFAPVCVPG